MASSLHPAGAHRLLAGSARPSVLRV